mgnify:CR=1 FL=1
MEKGMTESRCRLQAYFFLFCASPAENWKPNKKKPSNKKQISLNLKKKKKKPKYKSIVHLDKDYDKIQCCKIWIDVSLIYVDLYIYIYIYI